jgi:hypothetical protein
MAGLQAIYEGACGGSCSGFALTWDALNGGAAAYYGMTGSKYTHFRDSGQNFGVDLNPNP